MGKSIELTEEQYDFLINLAGELLIQDCRATADPLYCVYQEALVIKADGYGGQEGWLDDEGRLVDDKHIQETVKDYRSEYTIQGAKLSDEEILEELRYKKVQYDWEQVPVGGQVYFTEKAAHEHIAMNHYHYRKPFVYVESAWRNPEIEKLRKIIIGLMT